ncbi:helix-turn-helix domain-containing protein [Clostridium tagluense]|uniref:helix-turn-helix domain-containing protein n=1 Tax=Clostridium tagluense TaxID=360422 RepID=UPI001CF48A7B|nr:helix-turn-helix domain-containing protein [Clostridium tagluense]MCB2299618.1 helix-turn-helix domain-containing protein [Clostridium tagluense]
MSKSKFIESNSQGYVNINKEFLFDSNLNNTDKTLYIVLQSICWGDKDSCFPSQKTLSQAINRSIRTIQRSLKKLKQLGYILVELRIGTSNIYTMLKKIISQKSEKAVKKVNELRQKFGNKKKQDNWNDYPQRDYDFDKLEKKLLGWE